MAIRSRQQKTIEFPRRGEVDLVHFDPKIGHEIQKTRPVVIVQNNVSNRYSPITIVAAISSHFADPPFPREVVIEPQESGLSERSAVIASQIGTVDRRRLTKRLGRLSVESVRRVDQALKFSLGLVDL